MASTERVRVLCVDDERQVLEGVALHLRHGYEVLTATSGRDALEMVRGKGPFEVVLTDMQMPGMDGAELLSRTRELAPDTTRMLLTGHAGVEAAIDAVNRGQIFRFLTKPCPRETLLAAFEAASRQYRLVGAERVLLEQTLVGCIKALSDVLSITSPRVFGKATRVRQHAIELVQHSRSGNRWVVEAAAVLAQLGYVAVPDEIVEKQQAGGRLSAEEQAMLDRTAALTESVLANIPRLELVRQVIAACAPSTGLSRKTPPAVAAEVSVLRIATDFEELVDNGVSLQMALDTMRGRRQGYDNELLETFAALKNAAASTADVREIPVAGLREGMVLVDDVRTTGGVLLVARGFVVTSAFIARARNFGAGRICEPLRVVVAGGGPSEQHSR
jgi:CheY-like chemotaxis protein